MILINALFQHYKLTIWHYLWLCNYLHVYSRYYFPTYENDNLLCQLEDDIEDPGGGLTDHHGNAIVIAEDNPVIDTILSEDSVRQDILASWH